MFLVFMPVPYVDATASASFPEKGKRISVSAAGMIVELGLAALMHVSCGCRWSRESCATLP